jgi:SAM-dependent methyltransferase
MTRPELELISGIAADLPNHSVIVEIGSFAGRSSAHWAANSRPTVVIFCIDPFDAVVDDFSFEHIQGDRSGVRGRASGELFAEQMRTWMPRVIAVSEASPPSTWSESADVIFVDGDHTFDGVRRDLEFWIDHLQPGGRLLGHDWDDARVREAVQAFAASCGRTAFVHPSTNVWELTAAEVR